MGSAPFVLHDHGRAGRSRRSIIALEKNARFAAQLYYSSGTIISLMDAYP